MKMFRRNSSQSNECIYIFQSSPEKCMNLHSIFYPEHPCMTPTIGKKSVAWQIARAQAILPVFFNYHKNSLLYPQVQKELIYFVNLLVYNLVYGSLYMDTVSEKIRKEITSWPGVITQPHRFGGIEFRLGKREIGHIHGDRLADLPFPMKTRNELVGSGRVRPHHVMPQSGWVSYWIENGENDVPLVVELFRIRYDQLTPKPQPRLNEGM
jgi:hypothetical protein